MNINTPNVNLKETQQQSKNNNVKQESSVKFSEELKELKETKTDKEDIKGSKKDSEIKTKEVKKEQSDKKISEEEALSLKNKEQIAESNQKEKVFDDAIIGLNKVVNQLNQSEEKNSFLIKDSEILTDNELEGDELINNDFNIQENKDLMPQMNPGMNFSGDQPFSSFMNNEAAQNKDKKLAMTESDLAEEAAILSTMAENIAIANKNQMLAKSESDDKKIELQQEQIISKKEVVLNNKGQVLMQKTSTEVKKKDAVADSTVRYDSIIMKQADVEVFTTLVNKGEVNLNDIAPKTAQGATQVSKTLADMLAKSMENNQPLRIDFDNDISVIIRISRDGKISADFLPSTQIAEAYLKENLPLLRQRFEDNNIEYENLNHRNSKEREKEDNRKKGRNNE